MDNTDSSEELVISKGKLKVNYNLTFYLYIVPMIYPIAYLKQ